MAVVVTITSHVEYQDRDMDDSASSIARFGEDEGRISLSFLKGNDELELWFDPEDMRKVLEHLA